MLYWNRFSDEIRTDFDDPEECIGVPNGKSTDYPLEKEMTKNINMNGQNGLNESNNAAESNKIGEPDLSPNSEFQSNAAFIKPTHEKPLWKRIIFFILGIENLDDIKDVESPAKKMKTPAEKMNEIRECIGSITESDGMGLLCSANALLLMTFAVFIWIFYK